VRLAQCRQRLGVALLQRGEQPGAEADELLGEAFGPLDHHREAVVRRGGGQVGQHAVQVHPGRHRPDQYPRIDRRFEQRQRPGHALDVLPVPDLEQPVGHRVPVAQQLVVDRQAEVEGAAERGVDRVGAVAVDGEGEGVLQGYQRIGEVVEAPRVEQFPVGLRGHRARRYPLGARAEQGGGEDVELGGLVDLLDGVPPEELVAPGDEVVDVAHDGGLLVGRQPQLGDVVRVERVLRHRLERSLDSRLVRQRAGVAALIVQCGQ
jgi:hypothetical protein